MTPDGISSHFEAVFGVDVWSEETWCSCDLLAPKMREKVFLDHYWKMYKGKLSGYLKMTMIKSAQMITRRQGKTKQNEEGSKG